MTVTTYKDVQLVLTRDATQSAVMPQYDLIIELYWFPFS